MRKHLRGGLTSLGGLVLFVTVISVIVILSFSNYLYKTRPPHGTTEDNNQIAYGCIRHWQAFKPGSYDMVESYVCNESTRLDDARIKFEKDRGVWSVWLRGAGYGEFGNEDAARAQAERIFAGRKAANPTGYE